MSEKTTEPIQGSHASDDEPTVRPRDRDADTDSENAPAVELTDRGHPEDTEWRKHTADLSASVDIATFEHHFHDSEDEKVEDLSARVELYPSDPERVNLAFEVDGVLRGYPFRFGAVEELSPTQADALAAALVDAATQARNGGVKRLGDHPDSPADSPLDKFDAERDAFGSTRIDVSRFVDAVVYDEETPDEVAIQTEDLDRGRRDHGGAVTLTVADARRLREDLDAALEARAGERRRYDAIAEADE